MCIFVCKGACVSLASCFYHSKKSVKVNPQTNAFVYL